MSIWVIRSYTTPNQLLCSSSNSLQRRQHSSTDVNPEIYALAGGSNVNYNFIDAASQTNILVYGNTQWIGYMSPDVKASRVSLYQSLNMGGISDWAIDMEVIATFPRKN